MGKRAREKEDADADCVFGTTGQSQVHPRSLYAAGPPCFQDLAQFDTSFASFLVVKEKSSKKATIDFGDPEALAALTKALLAKDFNLTWDLPNGHLVPPVPNRENYIHWIEDLLDNDHLDAHLGAIPHHQPDTRHRGIDIGTGASLIYPLLGVRLNKNWQFLATEICDESIQHAQTLIDKNNLSSQIEIRKPPTPQHVIQGVIHPNERFDFCMCNPPFYASADEMGSHPERSATGLGNELVTEGGEVAFVKKMIDDSVALGTRVRWYSAMIGRKDDLKELKKILFDLHVQHVRTTTLANGRTTRWGIAWNMEGRLDLSALDDKLSKSNSSSNLPVPTQTTSTPTPTTKMVVAKTVIFVSGSPQQILEQLVECFEAIEVGCKKVAPPSSSATTSSSRDKFPASIICSLTLTAMKLCGVENIPETSGQEELGTSILTVCEQDGQVRVEVDLTGLSELGEVKAQWAKVVTDLLELKASGELF